MDLVCLGISIVDHQAGALFYPTAEAVALELAKRIPALRYIYLHIGARAGDSEWAGRVAWWRAAGAGGLRKLQRVTSGLGTCVEQYLTSTNFEESQELDGAYSYAGPLQYYLCRTSQTRAFSRTRSSKGLLVYCLVRYHSSRVAVRY